MITMPVCEADPWRLQYFENVYCPPEVNIPTEDSDAWLWYPKHRWIYDKIPIARVFQTDYQSSRHGDRKPAAALGERLCGESHARAYVDDPSQGPPRQLGHGDCGG